MFVYINLINFLCLPYLNLINEVGGDRMKLMKVNSGLEVKSIFVRIVFDL